MPIIHMDELISSFLTAIQYCWGSLQSMETNQNQMHCKPNCRWLYPWKRLLFSVHSTCNSWPNYRQAPGWMRAIRGNTPLWSVVQLTLMPVVSKNYIGQLPHVRVPSRCHMPIIFPLWASYLIIQTQWSPGNLLFSPMFTAPWHFQSVARPVFTLLSRIRRCWLRSDVDGYWRWKRNGGKRFGVWEWKRYWFLYCRASWVSGILDDRIEQSLWPGLVKLRGGTAALRHVQSHM